MIRVKATVFTEWIDHPEFGWKTAELFLDYPNIEYYEDLVGGVVTDPNLLPVEIICSESEYDAIDLDENYTVVRSDVIDE